MNNSKVFLLLPLLFLLLISSTSLQVSSLSCLRECGTFGPAQWVNSHVSDLIAAGIGSPLSIETPSPLNLYKFPGGQNFKGAFGCRPKALRFQNETAKLNFRFCDSFVSQTTDFDGSSDPFARSTFSNITVRYKTCVPKVNSVNNRYLRSLLVSHYEQFDGSFPTGLRVNFQYDANCRVKSLTFSDVTSGEVQATTTFFYSRVWWLPSVVRRVTEAAITTQTLNYRLDSRNRNIVALNSTLNTTNIGSPSFFSIARELWTFEYDSTGVLLESAETTQFSRGSPVGFRLNFTYDNRKRWTAINYLPLTSSQPGTPPSPSPVFTVGYSSRDRMDQFNRPSTLSTIDFNY